MYKNNLMTVKSVRERVLSTVRTDQCRGFRDVANSAKTDARVKVNKIEIEPKNENRNVRLRM